MHMASQCKGQYCPSRQMTVLHNNSENNMKRYTPNLYLVYFLHIYLFTQCTYSHKIDIIANNVGKNSLVAMETAQSDENHVKTESLVFPLIWKVLRLPSEIHPRFPMLATDNWQ